MKTVFATIVLAVSIAALPAAETMQWTVNQLTGFIKSSAELKHDDRKVAEFLKKVKLKEKLTERTIEELIGYGAGPRTVNGLRDLMTASAALPEPVKEVPKVATPMPPPSAEEQNKLLNQVTEYARNYIKQLPDFLCTQVTRRYVDPAGLEFWQSMDTVTEKLSYVDRHENYQVILVNNRAVTGVSHEQLGGTTSSGEFGTLMRDLFEPEVRAEFGWERWAKLRGRLQHVFAYRVIQPRSKYSVSWASGPNARPLTIIAGYTGLVYADADTGLITRMTLNATEIPPDFPIQKIEQVLDYDFTKIGENEYLLPLKSVVKSRSGKVLSKNEIEFRNYRKFGTESVITFTPDALPEATTQEKPPQ
ncbi:hypothetical protein F183_A50990 [Bryobacterales bacterium F-183]|nr:hypothetical protein F183_A50990 [Bryobacterales bacterium F-183]